MERDEGKGIFRRGGTTNGAVHRPLTPGCMVLEGGAFRGVYTSGVLDALLQAGIQMQCTIGVSAGALTGLNYVAGQIGRAARINLTYRHDPRYVGPKALRRNRGVIGFDFLFDTVNQWEPFDEATFARTDRRFLPWRQTGTTGRPCILKRRVPSTVSGGASIGVDAFCLEAGLDRRYAVSGRAAAPIRFPMPGRWRRALRRSSSCVRARRTIGKRGNPSG